MVCPHFPARHALPRTMGLLNLLLSSQIRLVFFVCLFLRVRKKIKAFAKDTGCSENLLCLHLIFPVFFYCNRYLQTLGTPSHMRTRPYKASQNKSVPKFHQEQPQTLPYKSRGSHKEGHKRGQSQGLHWGH